jgi:hypothetical protein
MPRAGGAVVTMRALPTLAGLLLASQAWAFDVPQGPDRPMSGDECVRAFEPAFKAHYRDDVCKPCGDDMDGWPGARWVARWNACWARCSLVKRARHTQLMDARQACFDRAKQHAREEEEREKLERIDRLKTGEGVAKAAYAAAKVRELLDSPSKFFQRAASRLPKLIQRELRRIHQERPASVEAELHAYAFTYARYGATAARRLYGYSPLISHIQRDSLDALEDIHLGVMREFDTAMRRVDTELARSYSAPPSQFRGTPIRSFGGGAPSAPIESDRCGVLDTPAALDLSMDQPDEFERLSKACRRR